MTGRATNACSCTARPREGATSPGALAVHLGWPAPLHRSSTAPRSCVYGFGVTYSTPSWNECLFSHSGYVSSLAA